MKHLSMRRLAPTVIATALAAGTLLAAPSAQAIVFSDAQKSAATWLVEQPKIDGLFTSYYGPTRAQSFVDYGLNLDLWVALDTLGQETAGEKIYAAAIDGAGAYTDSFGTRYAGALGKLTAMVQRHGDDPTTTDGRNLVAQLEATVESDGAKAGRATDRDIATGDTVAQYESSNTIGQAWVVRALDTAGSTLADETLAYLLKQQCDDGSFRVAMQDAQCTTGGGSVDATAFAVQALDVVGGQSAAVDEATDWLAEAQQADGSFTDAGTSNANSTGVAAVVLADHEEPVAAARAAGWIEAHQVGSGDEEGALALDDSDFADASAAPIARVDRDRYVRAGVQAALALDALDPAASLVVSAPTTDVAGGAQVPVTATGLAANEPFAVRIGTAAVVRGTANASGEVATNAPAPSGTGTFGVTVQGTNNDRAGSTSVKVFGKKTLSLSLSSSTVKKNKRQIAKVSGLVAGETVTFRLSNKVVKTGKAYSNGTYTASFKVGSSTGKKTVKVTGAFANRTASKTFKVS